MPSEEDATTDRETEDVDAAASSELAGAPPQSRTGFIDRGAAADLRTIRQVLGGDGNAYRDLIDRHQRRVSGMMWRFSRDREVHEELVQEVFVQAYESLRNYRAHAPFEHWLARIATRVGYRHWKREKRVPETVPIEEWRDWPDDSEEAPAPEEAGARLHALLSQLPPRDRLVLTLRYVEERSVEHTAELTGWSETMVKVQAWRARRKLKALFERAERGPDHE
ncbi:MAG: RNA polymerase sigma factor [Armatimonadetes bacterium]|nr:RNA polymerase sigma factor [Armatimonadota bacterium]